MTRDLSPKERRYIIEGSFALLALVFLGILIGFAWVVSDVHDLSHDTADLAKNTATLSMNTASLSQDTARLAEETAALTEENQNRISDIQVSRFETCGRIYNGIREVFRPFFPPPPRTKAQQANLNKFNSTIAREKVRCEANIEKG